MVEVELADDEQSRLLVASAGCISDLKALIENKHFVKKNRVNPLEEGEEWKIEIIEELSLIKKGFLEIDMDEDDIEVMLESIKTD